MPTTRPTSASAFEPADATEARPDASARVSRAPWRLIGRDQALLYVACLVFLAALAARYAGNPWASETPVRKLRSGDQAAYRLDINRAGPAELDLLPGIGPSKAAAIVAYRKAHGPFGSVGELRNVRGISRKLADSLRELVTLGRPAPKGDPPR